MGKRLRMQHAVYVTGIDAEGRRGVGSGHRGSGKDSIYIRILAIARCKLLSADGVDDLEAVHEVMAGANCAGRSRWSFPQVKPQQKNDAASPGAGEAR